MMLRIRKLEQMNSQAELTPVSISLEAPSIVPVMLAGSIRPQPPIPAQQAIDTMKTVLIVSPPDPTARLPSHIER
jgi:hypothetical protein